MIQTLCANELDPPQHKVVSKISHHPTSLKKRPKKNTHIFPPSNLICNVTTASPTQIIANTPLNTTSLCSSLPAKLNRLLNTKQKINGPHRSQSRNPALIPFPLPNRLSGSITRPAKPASSSLAPLSPAPRRFAYAPLSPSSLSNIVPPNKYLGYKTSRILSQMARRSRRRVSQTVSSIVLVGARRSSPGMRFVQDVVLEEEEPMVPVRGARWEVEGFWRGSSKSSREAGMG